jgi:hypothetical protein
MKGSLTRLIMVATLALTQLPTATVHAKPKNANGGSIVMPVTGSVDGVANALTGTLEITKFVRENDTLTAVGTLTAGIKDATGGISRTIVAAGVSVPVTRQQASTQADRNSAAVDMRDS